MGPGLALATAAAIEQNASILIALGKKVNEARKFRSKCEALQKDAEFLQELLKTNQQAIDSLKTLADINECFTDIDRFVVSCRTWSDFDIGLEVFVKQRFPALRQRTRALMDTFACEVGIETLARQHSILKEIKESHSSITKEQKSSHDMLLDVRRYVNEERRRVGAVFTPTTGSPIQCDFSLDDPSLALTFEQCVDMVGRVSQVGRGTLGGTRKVICTIVEPSEYTSEYLKIYQGIQAGAGVQTLYGTLHANNDIYAIMEDLDGELTLSDVCNSKVQLSSIERLGIAYDLAKTVAWFHKAEICLKSLNDLTVVLKKLDSGKWYPILVGLERSRLFLVKTSTMNYDCRYEAPEFQIMGEHTWYSDIWALGTIIWQCIFNHFPFDERNFVYPNSKGTNVNKIRDHLLRNEYPGSLAASGIVHGISRVIQQCWRQRGDLRPPSAEVVVMMQKLYTGAAISALTPLIATNAQKKAEIIQQRLMEDIRRARQLNPPGVKNDLKVPSDLLVSDQDFEEFYLEDNEWDSVKSYVVGAALFWKLVHVPVDGRIIDDSPQHLLDDPIEKRYHLALKHLSFAAQTGYHEAYQEIWRAQAVLARYYKAEYDKFHTLT